MAKRKQRCPNCDSTMTRKHRWPKVPDGLELGKYLGRKITVPSDPMSYECYNCGNLFHGGIKNG